MNAFDVSASFDRGLDDLERLHAWLDTLAGPDAAVEAGTLQRIRLALAEAFSNAVLHGRSAGAARPVAVRIAFRPGAEARVCIDVTDHGPGFRLGPPTAPAEHAERGRGLIILRALAESVEYAGNTLSLRLRP